MPRTETTRRQYGPNNGLCPGDVTDEDRAVVFPAFTRPRHIGAPPASCVARRSRWDWLHRCRRVRVVSFAKGLSAGLNGSVLFPQPA